MPYLLTAPALTSPPEESAEPRRLTPAESAAQRRQIVDQSERAADKIEWTDPALAAVLRETAARFRQQADNLEGQAG